MDSFYIFILSIGRTGKSKICCSLLAVHGCIETSKKFPQRASCFNSKIIIFKLLFFTTLIKVCVADFKVHSFASSFLRALGEELTVVQATLNMFERSLQTILRNLRHSLHSVCTGKTKKDSLLGRKTKARR